MSTLRQTIEREFRERQRRNAKYSLRAFAKMLEISPATLSRFLRGQQELHPTLANQILKKLVPESQKRQSLLLGELGELAPISFDQEYESLSVQELAQFDRWEFSAVQELLRSKRRFQNPTQIARVLGRETSEIRDVLAILEKHGRVKKEKGLYRSIEGRFIALSAQHPESVKKILRGYLARGAEVVERIPPDRAHLSGSTFLSSPEKVLQAAEMIREFRRKLVRFLEGGEGEVLYRMQIHVFPLETEEKR